MLFAQNPSGIRPRPAPTDYAATQQSRNATYAASILPRNEVKRLFPFDISGEYLVFEVACFPGNAGPVKLTPADFRIRSPKGDFISPADAITVASVIQTDRTPRPPSRNDTNITASTNIGYESGTDPVTGQRTHGVYTGAGVGVERGASDPGPIVPPPPGSTSYDRKVLEDQLSAKALPEGSFSAPVAGFVYFPASRVKKKSGGYTLEYLGDDSSSVVLEVSAKAR